MDLKEYITQCVYLIFFFVLIYNINLSDCQEYVVRKFKHGKVRGLIELVHSGKKVERYFGIPYAKPPIGNRRFEPPEPAESWGDSILNALELPPACPQPKEGLKYIENYVTGFNRSSEDCLYLNIYVPRNAIHHRIMPVLFFVHGGSYNTGMGAMFDGRALAVEGVVVVTMNYRLGPLGFLETGDSHFPGNYGMLDQIAALKWVHENIEFFNGDPKHITLDGQSAGGCSVGLLMMSPLTQGMFRHVIMQSGSTLAHWAVTRTSTEPDIYFKAFTSEMGCLSNSTLHIKTCLQHTDGDRIQALIYTGFGVSSSLSPHFRPVVDGYFLPKTPEKLILSGDFDVKSVMVGSTKDEGLMAVNTLSTMCGNESVPDSQRFLTIMHCFKGDLPNIPGIVDLVIERYTDWPLPTSKENTLQIISEMVGDYYITAPSILMAKRLSSHNTTVYVYSFEYSSKFSQSQAVVHGDDLIYLSGFPLTGQDNFRFDEHDKKMSKMILHLWSNFIRNGLPSLVPHREFFIDRYTANRPVYARILSGIHHPQIMMEMNLKPKKMYFWNEQIPALKAKYNSENMKSNCSDRYIINNPNSWALIAACIGLSVLTVSFSIGYFRTRNRMNRLNRQNGLPITNRMV